MAPTLTSFLLARINEDEVSVIAMDCTCEHRDDQAVHPPQANCPERILAECDAKRQIVEMHAQSRSWLKGFGPNPAGELMAFETESNSCSTCGRIGAEPACTTLRFLALPYAGHEDYREEWKP